MNIFKFGIQSAFIVAAAAILVGCGPDDPIPRVCATGDVHGAILTQLGFTRVADGVAPGFNLDGMVSDGTDYVSCGQVDFTAPDGTTGVDNQLAKLVPDVENLVGGNAVDGLLQAAIDDGQLVILMELNGADDLVEDDCVDVSVQVGEKRRPSLGTDGAIESFQTFTPDPAAELSRTNTGQIHGGVLDAGPFQIAIPLAIFDVAFTIHVQDAHIRATIDEDGKMKGYLAGGVFPDEIVDGVKEGDGLEDIIPLLQLALNANTDLGYSDESGKCEQLSATLAMSAVPAFVRR